MVNRIGALLDTVSEWINYSDFVHGKDEIQTEPAAFAEPRGWPEIVEQYWLPLMEERAAA